jgi:hypothetical protein
VDVFGKQGNSKCPVSDCREYIGREYKFFLLVFSASYYLPKSGFVNALDFEGPAELAQYLIQLSSDKAAYNRFFEWKKYIGHDRNHPVQAFLCEMCIELLLEEVTGVVEPKSLGNLKQSSVSSPE